MRARGLGGPVLWPLLLVAAGVVLLLENFLLLGGPYAALVGPALLVCAGVLLLLRGDFVPDAATQTFGITRGSVEAATLEVSAGDVDVRARALQKEGRLAAGQYAPDARPQLTLQAQHALLRLDRAFTAWWSLADWEVALAQDLPWQVRVSTSLGQVQLDLADLIVTGGIVATGIGDIRASTPRETLAPLQLRSAMGSITLTTPRGHRARVVARRTRLFSVQVDGRRYEEVEPGVFLAKDAHPDAPLAELEILGTFGDAYLI